MNRLLGIINSMNYKDLKDIQKDLVEGNIGILIKNRITDIEKNLGYDERICPTCGSKVSEETSKYILTFGPSDFRKRAYFDEMDCMTFFIDKLNSRKKVASE